eukprot:m.21666 g.21666  ORF g.21666 m.21666 type:complete len:243 (+) comp3941_c0_seq1:636-1364(+)
MAISRTPLVVLLALLATLALGADVTVDTDCGPVTGEQRSDGGAVFRGIPYAADTGGQNRYGPPQPRAHWGPSPLDCRSFRPGCAQPHHNPDVPAVQSEDCLNLNMWVPPRNGSATKYPVMVFLHGGAFVEGSNRGPFDLYNGTHLSQFGVIIINANYRIGALGFLATDKGLQGNMGLEDQRMALQWIQRNIANFGGDRDRFALGLVSLHRSSTHRWETNQRHLVGTVSRRDEYSGPYGQPSF